MKPLLLIGIARWLLRLFLLLLGVGVAMSGWGMCINPESAEIGVLMLVAGLTRTVNIDLWNYWHFAFLGAMVFFVWKVPSIVFWVTKSCFIRKHFLLIR